MEPYQLSATEAARLMLAKKLSCEELTRSILARVEECEPTIKAWAYIDPDEATRRARELDKLPRIGALHGLAFGIKDVIDTEGMPTSYNSPLYFGHRPSKDAACVTVLRQNGMYVLGKTETAEFAAGGRFPATANAHNPRYSPGASSSGSAAAVGSGMAQLALGTQTGSSLIRPATYNGVYGFKPTHGRVSTEGAKMFAPSLDTIGWYGRSVDDLALLASAYCLIDQSSGTEPDLTGLRVGLCRGPNWQFIERGGEAALLSAAHRLADAGAIVEDLDLPDEFGRVTAAHQLIMRGEGRVTFYNEYVQHGPALHEGLRSYVETPIPHAELLRALEDVTSSRRVFDDLFHSQQVDVVLTPGAAGEAPLKESDFQGLSVSNAMVFCCMWTALHVPCIAIPVGTGRENLPLGIQLIGPRGGDSRLLNIAKNAAHVLDRKEPLYSTEDSVR